MTGSEHVPAFLDCERFAVAGASDDFAKFGAKVFACYVKHGKDVVPLNPTKTEVQGRRCYAGIGDLEGTVPALSVVTPPQVTEQIVEQAAEAGVEFIWMQPGAESPTAIARARKLGMKVIAGGPCLLVELGY